MCIPLLRDTESNTLLDINSVFEMKSTKSRNRPSRNEKASNRRRRVGRAARAVAARGEFGVCLGSGLRVRDGSGVMRRNGFFANGRVSLNLHQLAAGTAYVALLVAFYATQSPVFANAGTRAGLEIAFAVMTCFVLVLFAKAAGTDPGDVGGGTHVSGTHGVGVGVDANDDDPQTSPEMLFCDLCAKDVSHGSKHCRTCDKCVKHFDHHCVWLNNCVGSKNYHSFLVLVFGTFLQVVGQLVIGAYLTHGAVTKKDDTNETLRRNGVFLTRQTWLVCSTCVMLFGFVTAYVLGDLLGFHFILNKRGLTTLEFISASRDKGEVRAFPNHHIPPP
jgi:hypothetical protein